MLDKTKSGLQSRGRLLLWGSALLLLLLPLIAMQFTHEVNWDVADFIVFGVMLIIACGSFELAARMISHKVYKITVGLVIALIFLFVWASLALGLFSNVIL